MKFLVINDFNDINSVNILHFSMDKGHYIAKSLTNKGAEVYFMTTLKSYDRDSIKYINMDMIDEKFLSSINYVIIAREPVFAEALGRLPALKNHVGIPIKSRSDPKIIVRSDSPMWATSKVFNNNINKIYGLNNKRSKWWPMQHVDYIGCQNQSYYKMARAAGFPDSSLILSDMSISPIKCDVTKLVNPYDPKHSYCVKDSKLLGPGGALVPKYYVDNPGKINEMNKPRKIIIYTGRLKTDGGKIMFNMINIMKELESTCELHIFPSSFFIPLDEDRTRYSSKNANHLAHLRDRMFAESKNIFVHYPYSHDDKYRYLHFADCGIDFSDVRPDIKAVGVAGHAKILEYCELGLPIVCEGNINNLHLIRRGKNGIILPFMASDRLFILAIKRILSMKVDREFCRKVTWENENWDVRAQELIDQLNAHNKKK